MSARHEVVQTIGAIQQMLPADAVASMRLTPVQDPALDELHARLASAFPPIFLPVFERDGDLYAVHIQPHVRWMRGAWLFLPHDETEASLVASRIEFLPGGLVAQASRVDEVWSAASALTAAIEGAPPLARETFDRKLNWSEIRAAVDPDDIAALLSVELDGASSRTAAGDVVRRTLSRAPSDTVALAAEAQRRSALGSEDPAPPALAVLEREVTWGFGHPMAWFVKSANSGPAILESVRSLAAPLLATTPLAPLEFAPYTEAATANVLAQVSESLASQGQHSLALAQVRNGAAVVAAWGAGIDRAWCERLAEQSERVEPGGLSAALARHAAEVIEQGP